METRLQQGEAQRNFDICDIYPQVCNEVVPIPKWPWPGPVCLSCPIINIDPSTIIHNEGIIITSLPNDSFLITKVPLNNTQGIVPQLNITQP